jgi:energy-coupling factor transporter ATP-binding protein EcfA2
MPVRNSAEQQPNAPLLAVRGVSKRFGGLLAVSDVSFTLDEGQILGLIGPNGAGKTTLFNVVNGVYKADGGTISFLGKEITGSSPDKVVHLGLARTHQIVKPLHGMSVLETVIAYRPGEHPQRTLVLIKPENFRFPTGRPGNMIDFFSRTGLFIVGVKVHRMSVAEAVEFYGPVRETLHTRLLDEIDLAAKGVLREEAYRCVQRNAMQAWETAGDFRALVLADPDISGVLNREDVERAFDFNRCLTNVDAIFDRVFGM